MSMNFTTGSWITEESLTPDGRGTGTYNIYQNSEDGHWVAFTGTVHDARLIAAAPDLLDALQWITRCASIDGSVGTTAYIISDKRMAEVRAAIAKATGVQS